MDGYRFFVQRRKKATKIFIFCAVDFSAKIWTFFAPYFSWASSLADGDDADECKNCFWTRAHDLSLHCSQIFLWLLLALHSILSLISNGPHCKSIAICMTTCCIFVFVSVLSKLCGFFASRFFSHWLDRQVCVSVCSTVYTLHLAPGFLSFCRVQLLFVSKLLWLNFYFRTINSVSYAACTHFHSCISNSFPIVNISLRSGTIRANYYYRKAPSNPL